MGYFRDFLRLQNEMNNLFNDFDRSNQSALANRPDEESAPMRAMAELPLARPTWGSNLSFPRIDVRDNEKSLLIHADLPGIPREDVKVDLESGCACVSARVCVSVCVCLNSVSSSSPWVLCPCSLSLSLSLS
eukprot:GHVU01179346.1.p2 GENE.GHVU01179346.1~~GHVU01179346.1.p2  ORF type:complete len:132 (-),score=7.62 GHVU01179346.1:13-408(-)